MDDIYDNIEKYNPNKIQKRLIVFDNTIADMRSNKNLNAIVIELFIRRRKINNPLFLSQNLICLYQKILD